MKTQKLWAIIGIFLLLGMMNPALAADNGANQTITDLAGRTVDIPSDVQQVAALVGPSYEKVFLLGAQDKMALIPPFPKQMPWAAKVISNLKDISSMTSFQDPNIEELMNQKIDVVFFWDYPKPLQKMIDTGIPVVITQPTTTESQAQSVEQFRDMIKNEVSTFGAVLGSDAGKKAEKYNQYFDEKVDKILKVTSAIPDNERLKVYYVRGPDALTTHGKNTYTQWWVNMAGGNLVSSDVTEMIPKVNMEQVINWNPDIIVMGRMNSTSLILDDPKWKDIAAVKSGKVYTNPDGVMYWDYSSEGVLLLEYLAKLFYPDKFTDIDMKKEIKEYYSMFYNYTLTDDEAGRILDHLPPA
ncbi:MAG: ABC transporter substrate-binding protein [Methanobacteriota archaeon]